MIPRDCHGPLRGLAMTSLTAGSMREGFLQSFPNREARKKSARAEGERFFVEARFGERRNTLCISSSPNRWIGGKAPASAAEDFFRVFPTGKLGRNQQERLARDFSSRRGLGNAGVLCVLQTFQTDELAENIRHLPQRISSEFSQQGSSEEISKSGGREIFRRVEVRGTQEYFVYFKFPEPMDRRKSSGIRRR